MTARATPVGKRSYGLIIGLALLVALAFQGTRGLYETSEGRYAEVAREMRESGHYLEPTLGTHPHWTKPPLTYWTIAGGLATAGNNPWGVRAVNAVAFSLTVLAVALIGSSLWNPGTGFLAAMVYLSSPYPVIAANATTADTLLALWATLAVLAYVRARRSQQSAWWIRLMWVMFGLGFFTKGPPALLPLLALVVFHLIARRPFRLFDPIGVALFVVTGFWWYGLMVFRHPELGSYFIGKEVVGRSFSSAFHRNSRWYGALVVYVPVLLLGPGAWLVDGVRIVRRRGLFSPRRLFSALSSPGTPGSLLAIWFFLPLVIFAMSKSRLPLYILPLYAAVALAIARGIHSMSAPGTARRRVTRLAVISIALLIALKAVAAYRPSDKDATRVYREAARMAGPDAGFALFREPAFFGFQFSAGPGMERITTTGTESWADRRLDQALASRPSGRNYVIVTTRRDAPELKGLLQTKHERFEEERIGAHDVFVISPVSSSPQHLVRGDK